MSRAVPYLICRYRIIADGSLLDANGQEAFFSENQGQARTYYTRSDKPNANALIMEFERVNAGGFNGISFYIGYQPGYRKKVGYDNGRNKRTVALEPDDHIKSAHIVAIPALGCMAIEDRSNEDNVPQGIAIKALRSIIDECFEDGEIDILHLTDAEVTSIVTDWQIIQYDYEIRPLNPIRLSDFNEMRSDAMKADRIARDAGKFRPAPGETMQSTEGGLLTETQEMVDAGYGQSGLRAITPDGDEARVPKPKFHLNKTKNFAEREKPRFLKIMFESEEGAIDKSKIVDTVGRFYGTD